MDHLLDYGNLDRSAATAEINIEGFFISDVDVSIFRHRDDENGENTSWFTASKRLAIGAFANLGAGCALSVDALTQQVALEMVELGSDMTLQGGHIVSHCWAKLGVTTTVPANVSVSHSKLGDNSSTLNIPAEVTAYVDQVGRMRWLDDTNAQIDFMGARFLNARAGGPAADGTRKSQIVHGCELFPSKFDLGGGNDAASVEVLPGSIVLPNGLKHTITARMDYQLMTGVATAVIPIDKASVVLENAGTDISFVYCYLRKKTSDLPSTAAIRISVDPPDRYGRPQAMFGGGAEAVAGYTVDDYAFLGTLTLQDAVVVAGSSMFDIWGNGSVVEHLGGGRRKFGIALRHDNLGATTVPGADSNISPGINSGSPTQSITVINGGSWLFNPSNKLYHAAAAEVTVSFRLYNSTSNSIQIRLYSKGMSAHVSLPGVLNHYSHYSDTFIAPLDQASLVLVAEYVSGSGTISGLEGKQFVNAIIENLNSLGQRPTNASVNA